MNPHLKFCLCSLIFYSVRLNDETGKALGRAEDIKSISLLRAFQGRLEVIQADLKQMNRLLQQLEE